MEVNFTFSSNGLTIKKTIQENEIISSILNNIVEEESLNININFLLCKGSRIDGNNTFKNNKIKNGDAIMIISDYVDLDETVVNQQSNKYEVVKCITKHSHVNLKEADLNAFIDRTFTVFKSLNNQYLLIHSYSEDYKNYSLFCYDILKEKIVKTIFNAHNERIFTCSHFLDKYNQRDLLITGAFDKKIKIWNISYNFEKIYEKKPDYYYRENTYLLSETLLSYNKKIYLIASAYEIKSTGYNILYYSLSNDENGTLKDSKDNTNYLDTFYNNNNPYIITANCGNIKIFNFSSKELIKVYSDTDKSLNYLSVVIMEYNNKFCLIGSSSDGFLRIWDINKPDILYNKLKTYQQTWLIGLLKLDEQYILGAGGDGTIKEFDLKANYMSRSFERKNYNDPLFTLRYININGENYLFSHSHKGIIELWKNNIE